MNVRSPRRVAEEIEDPVQRQEALSDLARLENAESELQSRLAEIECDAWEKHYAYKPLPKFRLTLFALSGGLGSIWGFGMLLDILESGSLIPPKSDRIIEVATNPIAYTLWLGFHALGEAIFVFATLFCVLALVKYPHPPFKWMLRKPASCK